MTKRYTYANIYSVSVELSWLKDRTFQTRGENMRVAMISYNAFVDGESNGWKDKGGHAILLLQNADGNKWGTAQFANKTHEQWYDETKALVDPLWRQLVEALPTIDKVVFYVGSYGAERVIDLAAEHGLTPDKAVFVRCTCNLNKKMGVIRERGFSASKIMDCECGGHITMRRLYDNVLTEGRLPN